MSIVLYDILFYYPEPIWSQLKIVRLLPDEDATSTVPSCFHSKQAPFLVKRPVKATTRFSINMGMTERSKPCSGEEKMGKFPGHLRKQGKLISTFKISTPEAKAVARVNSFHFKVKECFRWWLCPEEIELLFKVPPMNMNLHYISKCDFKKFMHKLRAEKCKITMMGCGRSISAAVITLFRVHLFEFNNPEVLFLSLYS